MAHVALVIAIGGVAGTLIAPLVKLALTADWAWGLTFSNGALIGMKYAGLWAMGIALIWCVMRHNRRAKGSTTLSGPTICEQK